MQRKWLILAAVSLAFFFLNAATFTSLGVVLFTMVKELSWSQTAAGFSFSLLGIACGLSSPLPAATLRRFGGRFTVASGALVLCAGFFLAAGAHNLPTFYLATTLLGIGYSLCGNVPGIHLIAGWFPYSSARMIGIYLMVGASGSVIGPLLVEAIVAGSGSWRFHWLAMAVVAALVGFCCLAWVRDIETRPAAQGAKREREAGAWSYREAMFSSQFLLVAASMTMTMAGVTTISSVALPHLVRLGETPTFAALVLSLVSLVATVAKGVAGRLCEYFAPRNLLSIGLVLQAFGNFALGSATTQPIAYVFVLTFGLGWGLSFLAANVVLLQYFGRDTGARVLSMVWVVATLAAIGPLAAGVIADHFDTMKPIFDVYAVLMLLLTVPTVAMQAPARGRTVGAEAPQRA